MHFPTRTLRKIDEVMRRALSEGRKILFEHEVYRILDCIGLETPRFVFLEAPSAVDAPLLQQFGSELILKIVSSDIAHKQRLGGVRKVQNHEPPFVQYVLNRMKSDVLNCFSADDPPDIKGFLLVEYIPHTQAIGYEVLLGIQEDPAFGPVLTLSKGGDDAEFFARYYDPANLFLPPLKDSDARELVYGLNIRRKFDMMGKTALLDRLAEAARLLSWLAYHYSFISEKRPAFIIKSLDVNPFVLSEDNRFVAVDGFASFSPAEAETVAVPPCRLRGLEGFFAPQGIAVAGVSAAADRQSLGRIIARQLLDIGRDDIFFINPKDGDIRLGEKTYPLYPSVRDLPAPVDLVVYAAPARHILDFIRHLPESGPRAVILIPGIPSDMEYADFSRLIAEANEQNIRIIGPNCMGVFSAPDAGSKGINTLFVEENRLDVRSSENSNTVLLTQSGAFSLTAIDKFQNARILKAIVSLGNKSDVNFTDLIAFFAEKPGVDLISLYVEGLEPGEGRRFFQLAGTLSVPVIVYKSGRTDAGARVTASHTASMSGSYDVFRAACLQAGVIVADNIEDHYDLVKIFSLLAKKKPSGCRVAGVVNAGFESAVGADELTQLKQAELSPETREKLREMDTSGLIDTGTSFLDVTPMADDRLYADYTEALLLDENVDCVFVSVVPYTNTLKTLAETCRDPDSLASLLVDLNRKYAKPMVVSVNAGKYYQEFVKILEENGLPVYNDIRSAVYSLDRFAGYYSDELSIGG